MIALSFETERPADPALARGWEAEKQMAFYLARAFSSTSDVLVFNGLRLAAPRTINANDHVQIDHLVVHCHGAVVIESKATGDGSGLFEVDARDQWVRRASAAAPGYNMDSPVKQAERQVESLRRLLDDAQPPLLGKVAGLLQQRFGAFPIRPMVALSDRSRVVGDGAARLTGVMKAEAVVSAVRDEMGGHRRHAGLAGLLRKDTDKGVFTLRHDELARIKDYLLGKHVPRRSAPPPAPAVPQPAPTPRAEALEALTCRHCRSIRVRVVYRRDYCLLCEECGKYTPLDRTCLACGKPATIRKAGPLYSRVCDKEGGCGSCVAFWRDGARG